MGGAAGARCLRAHSADSHVVWRRALRWGCPLWQNAPLLPRLPNPAKLNNNVEVLEINPSYDAVSGVGTAKMDLSLAEK